MTDLRTAAKQALEALEDFGMKHYENTGEVLHRDVYDALRAALAEDAMQKFTDVNQELQAALAEPVKEPYAWMAVGGTIWRHKTSEDDVPLYTAPRAPLAEWQINDLMADIDPEDRDSWSFRQGVYAAEKHHGVRK